MKTIIKAILVGIFISTFSAVGLAQTLHFVIFGATLDPKIGTAVETSINLLQSRMNAVSRATQMPLQVHQFTEENFNKSDLEDFLKNFKCDQNDAVVAFFLTHGFRYQDDLEDFPYLLIHRDYHVVWEELPQISVALQDIHDWLAAKRPRLLLTMAEACNVQIPRARPEHLTAYPMNNKALEERVYTDLFRYASGEYLMVSAKANQKSWSNPKYGGFFTNAWLNALNKEAESDNWVNWTDVLNSTQHFTELIAKDISQRNHRTIIQTPFWQ